MWASELCTRFCCDDAAKVVADLTERFLSMRSAMRAFLSLEHKARLRTKLSLSTRSFCASILFVRLEALRGSERRVVRIVGMVGLTLDETPNLVR